MRSASSRIRACSVGWCRAQRGLSFLVQPHQVAQAALVAAQHREVVGDERQWVVDLVGDAGHHLPSDDSFSACTSCVSARFRFFVGLLLAAHPFRQLVGQALELLVAVLELSVGPLQLRVQLPQRRGAFLVKLIEVHHLLEGGNQHIEQLFPAGGDPIRLVMKADRRGALPAAGRLAIAPRQGTPHTGQDRLSRPTLGHEAVGTRLQAAQDIGRIRLAGEHNHGQPADNGHPP